MAYHILKKREVKWACQVEEGAEDKVVDKAADKAAEDWAVDKVEHKAKDKAKDKLAADQAAARGPGPKIYAAARLAGPAPPMNAGFPAFR
jgi:hypothetical protein